MFPWLQARMAGLEDRLRGYRKENLVGDSDSEDEGRASRRQARGSEIDGARVPPPAMDGIPKVRPDNGSCFFFLRIFI